MQKKKNKKQINFDIRVNFKSKSVDGKEAIPKARGSKKQMTNPPHAPAGDAVSQAPRSQPNLYLIRCCCSCGTEVVYLSGSKCLSVWQPAEYIKQALQTLYGPGSE